MTLEPVGRAGALLTYARGLFVAALAAVFLVVAACSTDDSDTDGTQTPAEVTTIDIAASEFAFAPDELTVSVDETVRLRLINEGSIEHDLEIEGLEYESIDDGDSGHGHDSALAVHTDPGETEEVTFRANEAGTFEFFCTIEGHRDAGMEGILIVN